jgi:hypothetical protein
MDFCCGKSEKKHLGEKCKMVRKELLIYPFLTFALYLVLAFYVLLNGHLHEDAYILYIFSESFASGNGISYYPGGLPAEGATDFLWMILLGVGKFFGMDVAISASILNALGISVITFFGIKLASKGLLGFWLNIFSLTFALIVPLSQIGQASLAGFSTGFYVSFVAALFYLIFERKKEHLYFIPLLGIILGLLRPDGVIIGVFASFIGLFLATKESVVKKYIISSLVAFCVGIIYFFWRYEYFGNILPLPLYVKGASPESLPGLVPHFAWAIENEFLGVIAIVTFAVCKYRERVFLASIPVGMLFVALVFATLSQNVAYRLQAPGTVLLLMWSSILVASFSDVPSKFFKIKKVVPLFVATLFLASAALHARGALKMVGYLTSNEYINYFPYHLASSFDDETVIALTEAGRFAYWVAGDKYDLVGLNTPEVALNKSSPEYINEINPDIIFMHVDGTTNFDNFCEKSFCRVTERELLSGVSSKVSWEDVSYGVGRAPLTVFAYISGSNQKFFAYIVKYGINYDHVYLLKSGGNISAESFEKALELSFYPEGMLSYWEMKKLRDWSSIFD